MKKNIVLLLLIAFTIFIIDQYIKSIFLNGFRWEGEFFSLILTFNKGVAFSMFAFLGEYLKYIQILLILVVFIFIFQDRELLSNHTIAFGVILGAGCGNIYDRFIHGGVVDYVFWHKWFHFAVFNFADVMIDCAIFLILFQMYQQRKKSQQSI